MIKVPLTGWCSKEWHFFILNDKPMSKWLGVEHWLVKTKSTWHTSSDLLHAYLWSYNSDRPCLNLAWFLSTHPRPDPKKTSRQRHRPELWPCPTDGVCPLGCREGARSQCFSRHLGNDLGTNWWMGIGPIPKFFTVFPEGKLPFVVERGKCFRGEGMKRDHVICKLEPLEMMKRWSVPFLQSSSCGWEHLFPTIFLCNHVCVATTSCSFNQFLNTLVSCNMAVWMHQSTRMHLVFTKSRDFQLEEVIQAKAP